MGLKLKLKCLFLTGCVSCSAVYQHGERESSQDSLRPHRTTYHCQNIFTSLVSQSTTTHIKQTLSIPCYLMTIHVINELITSCCIDLKLLFAFSCSFFLFLISNLERTWPIWNVLIQIDWYRCYAWDPISLCCCRLGTVDVWYHLNWKWIVNNITLLFCAVSLSAVRNKKGQIWCQKVITVIRH